MAIRFGGAYWRCVLAMCIGDLVVGETSVFLSFASRQAGVCRGLFTQ
ncbi:MAG: hypothetical protein LBQ66_09315 [Planctomycetaceae bacterium]|nr:hypothetical protein [Planctomycetaceae bacterium]